MPTMKELPSHRAHGCHRIYPGACDRTKEGLLDVITGVKVHAPRTVALSARPQLSPIPKRGYSRPHFWGTPPGISNQSFFQRRKLGAFVGVPPDCLKHLMVCCNVFGAAIVKAFDEAQPRQERKDLTCQSPRVRKLAFKPGRKRLPKNQRPNSQGLGRVIQIRPTGKTRKSKPSWKTPPFW